MNLKVDVEREEDGRWIAEVMDLPGVLAYGATRAEAIMKAQALALRVVADRLENGEETFSPLSVSFIAA
jgi:predicted RNase H-like HicB family nuclease